jgi:hypothetical protein
MVLSPDMAPALLPMPPDSFAPLSSCARAVIKEVAAVLQINDTSPSLRRTSLLGGCVSTNHSPVAITVGDLCPRPDRAVASRCAGRSNCGGRRCALVGFPRGYDDVSHSPVACGLLAASDRSTAPLATGSRDRHPLRRCFERESPAVCAAEQDRPDAVQSRRRWKRRMLIRVAGRFPRGLRCNTMP